MTRLYLIRLLDVNSVTEYWGELHQFIYDGKCVSELPSHPGSARWCWFPQIYQRKLNSTSSHSELCVRSRFEITQGTWMNSVPTWGTNLFTAREFRLCFLPCMDWWGSAAVTWSPGILFFAFTVRTQNTSVSLLTGFVRMEVSDMSLRLMADSSFSYHFHLN